LASDEVAFGEEAHGSGDVFWSPEALQGDASL
jgi:hypothetical protein